MKKPWTTEAHWPDGKTSTDTHHSEDADRGVARRLMREGNTLGKPLKVDIYLTPGVRMSNA